MSIDQNGFIKSVEAVPWQAEFLPVLDDLCCQLDRYVSSLIQSVYVYGSVAAGTAVPCNSDLDLCLILNRSPSKQEKGTLERIKKDVNAAHRIVSKVDFDLGTLEEISSPETSIAWHFWLKHHCRCIKGDDLAKSIPLFKPSQTLALSLNGDFEQVLGNYMIALTKAQSETTIRKLIKESARKAIRSTNILRLESDPDWPDSLEDHVIRFERSFPEKGDEMRYLLTQAKNPDAKREDFSTRLQNFTSWMTLFI